ncbi:sporulation protein Cse60 [Streptococcus thermophilus]|nr:sporulation protein Cse60 [Streptococcus thermophilus]
MIRVHEIITDNLFESDEKIEKLIEEYLSKKKDIELIDIKYQVSTYENWDTFIHRTSALIIYKDKC